MRYKMKQAKRKNKLAFEANLDDLIILLALVAVIAVVVLL